jgi:hypothetical protein
MPTPTQATLALSAGAGAESPGRIATAEEAGLSRRQAITPSASPAGRDAEEGETRALCYPVAPIQLGARHMPIIQSTVEISEGKPNYLDLVVSAFAVEMLGDDTVKITASIRPRFEPARDENPPPTTTFVMKADRKAALQLCDHRRRRRRGAFGL